MTLYPKDFVRLYDNRYRDRQGSTIDHAVIAFLPLSLGAYMPTLSTDIRLGVEYARKMIQKHGLKYEALSIVQSLVEDSYCFKEKPKHLTFMGWCPRDGVPYTMVLKAARGGTETWLATFHRTMPAQVRSKVGRARTAGTLFRELAEPFYE